VSFYTTKFTIKCNVHQSHDASFNANLIVGGNTIINGETNLLGNLSVNNITNRGSLVTSGTSTTIGNVNVGSNLIVDQNTTLNGRLLVGSNATVNGSLNVMRDLSVNGRLMVTNYLAGSIPIGAIAGGAGLALGSFANDVNIGKNFYVGDDEPNLQYHIKLSSSYILLVYVPLVVDDKEKMPNILAGIKPMISGLVARL
jgi:hypothetical protein